MGNNVAFQTGVGATPPANTIVETIDQGGGVERQVFTLGSVGKAGAETQITSIAQETGGNLATLATNNADGGTVAAASVTSAATIFSIDTTGYASIAVQVTSVGSGNTVLWEQSNDNTNWVGKNLTQDGINNGLVSFQNQWTTGNNQLLGSIHFGPVTARYFRARVSTYGSGTVTAEAYLRRVSIPVDNIGSIPSTAPGDGGGTNLGQYVLGQPFAFNGSTWDRQRNNLDTAALVTLAAAGASTVNSVDQTNYNGRGVQVGVNLTIVTTATVTVHVQGKDIASGTYYDILVSTALAAAGFTNLTVYPGSTAATNLDASAPLPRTWRVQAVVVGASAAVTGTIGASVIL